MTYFLTVAACVFLPICNCRGVQEKLSKSDEGIRDAGDVASMSTTFGRNNSVGNLDLSKDDKLFLLALSTTAGFGDSSRAKISHSIGREHIRPKVAWEASRPQYANLNQLGRARRRSIVCGDTYNKGDVEAELIDGKVIAQTIRGEIKQAAADLEASHGVVPGLAVIMVGSRKDSATYVRNKKKAAAEVNFHTIDIALEESATQEELLKEVAKLNDDPKIHGILIQLPLPKHIDECTVLKAIKVEKDADGFSAMNIGNLCLKGGDSPLAVPCTPAGCIELLKRSRVDLSGKRAVVIGRSNIVGMPVSQLLQCCDCTVTVCHSRTKNVDTIVKAADILVAAIGEAHYVQGHWLKPGCVVIDVGINAVDDPSKKAGYRLVGDVDFNAARYVASKITPVPGGVGPMTIAMLLKNTLNLARHSVGEPRIP